MILLIRVLPFLLGCLEAALFWSQRGVPKAYPWLVILGAAIYAVSALAISWKRLHLRELAEIMAPSFILLLVLGFAILLAEGSVQLGLVSAMAGIVSLVSLELLFLQTRNPALYPVNGLSHLNVAIVPIAIWYTVSTATGLLVFLNTSGVQFIFKSYVWWYVLSLTVLCYFLFRTTSHRDATLEQKRIWALVGGLVGLQVGLLWLLLPVSMAVQGLLAAVLVAGVMRARRYVYAPKPSTRTALVEMGIGLVAFIASLVTAKWL